MEHTKGKLVAQFDSEFSGGNIFSDGKIGKREFICTTSGNARANAAHIVKCWNMHDELVEALRKQCLIIDTLYEARMLSLAEADVANKAKALLAEAEKE